MSSVPDVSNQHHSSALALASLALLLPHRPHSELAQAVEASSAEPLGYIALVEACLASLDANVLELSASPRDLVARPESLPALEVDAPHRLLVRLSKRRFEIFDHRGRRLIDESEMEADRVRRFLVVSHALALDPIRAESPVRRLYRYLKQERALVRLVLVYAVGVELLSLSAPLTVQVLINTIGFGMLIQPLVVLSLVLFLSLAGAALLRLMQTVTVEAIVRRFVQRVVVDLAARIPRLSAGAPPEPAHRFFEIAGVDKSLFVLGLDLVSLALQVATATVLLAVYHPLLLGFACLLALSTWLALLVPFRSALGRNLKESSAKYAIAAWLARGDTASDVAMARLLSKWQEARKASFGMGVVQQVALYTIQVVMSALLLLLGGRLVIEGQLTLGQLVAAELVTTAALVSLGKIGKQLPKVYDLLTSFEKLGALVDAPLSASTSAEPHPEAIS